MMRRLLLVVIGALLLAAPAESAKPIWELGQRALVKKTEGYLQQPAVAAFYRRASRTERRGMKKLLVAAGNVPGARTKPRLPYGLGNGLNLFRVFIRPDWKAEETLKGFLDDMDTLYDWAKQADDALVAAGQQPRHVQDVGELALKFGSRNVKDWKGAWYEIRLAARYARGNPPRLQRIQPPAPRDALPFRDGGIAWDPQGSPGLLAYLEAKNWPDMSVRHGRQKLMDQVDSHFRRLKSNPDLVGLPPDANGLPRLPPGLKLVYEFNGRLPPSWVAGLRAKAKLAIQEHFGVDEDVAKRWVDEHLHIQRTDL